jgi:hypothetical protein
MIAGAILILATAVMVEPPVQCSAPTATILFLDDGQDLAHVPVICPARMACECQELANRKAKVLVNGRLEMFNTVAAPLVGFEVHVQRLTLAP